MVILLASLCFSVLFKFSKMGQHHLESQQVIGVIVRGNGRATDEVTAYRGSG